MSNPPSIPRGPSGEVPLVVWDPVGLQLVPLKGVVISQDSSGQYYATLATDVTVSVDPAANQEVNTKAGDIAAGSAVSGAFVAGSIVDLATLLTEFSELLTDTDNLGTIATNTSGVATQTTLASILTNLALGQKAKSASLPVALASDQGTNAAPISTSQTLGGNALSATNPEPNISNIQQLILNGQSFVAATGKQSAGVNAAAQFLIANSGSKNILIYSIQIGYTNAAQMHQVQLITATDANITTGTGHTVVTPQNLDQGSVTTSEAAESFTYCTAIANSGVATGQPLADPNVPLNQTVEVLTNGQFVYIPPSTAGGIAVYMQTTAAGQFSIAVKWCEF